MLTPDGRLQHGIGRALNDLAKLGLTPSPAGLDLLILAAHVQAADTRISRASESQDSWTREIRIVVPVSDPELWSQAVPTLKRALDFLTGDLWTIEFRASPKRPTTAAGTVALPLARPFDQVSLYSGGLDSLIGAIDSLEGGRTPLFVSHAGEGATSDAQTKCYRALKEHYTGREFGLLRLWMDLQGIEIPSSAHEMTTRGRSFLFFALGVFAGSGLNKPFTLVVPENGFIALNVPLDPLRLGSHSTRTTHPFFIARWNELLGISGIPGRVENPYWNQTKGEMVAGCANLKLLRRIAASSLSCSSPTKARWGGLPTQHCGYCMPCLIRRAALLKGLGRGSDKTAYTLDDLAGRPLNSAAAEGLQIRSFQYAIRRQSRKPGRAEIMIHSSGSLSDQSAEHLAALVDMYRRGLAEVGQILKGVRTRAE